MTEFNMPFAPGNPLYAEELDKLSNHVHDGVVGLKGHADFIHNAELAPEAGQIKSDFYSWYERVKAAPRNTGFGIDYTAGKVIIKDSVVTIAAGSIFAPPSATSFVVINNLGAVVIVNTIPDEAIPILKVTTNGIGITSSQDCRRQSIEVMPRVPSVQSIPVGTVWMYFGTSAPSGWLLMQGQVLSRTTYDALFTHLLNVYPTLELPSSTTFKLPDMRGRSPICAGQGSGLTNRALGSVDGVESVVLSQAQMPAHNHAVLDPGHNHTIVDGGHSHSIADPGHGHPVIDPGHSHYVNKCYDDEAGRSQPGPVLSAQDPNNPPADYLFDQRTDNVITGVSTVPVTTNVQVVGAYSNTSNLPATTGVNTLVTGGGAAHTNMHPVFGIQFMIKT